MFEFLKRIRTAATPTMSHDEIQKIVNAYGDTMGAPGRVLRDPSKLPYPKARIKQALIAAIRLTPAGADRKQLKSGYVMLGDYQETCKTDRTAAMLADGNVLLEELRSLGF